eukprot:scaffold190694_cov23-Tisochrysis_lutea.AAC.1
MAISRIGHVHYAPAYQLNGHANKWPLHQGVIATMHSSPNTACKLFERWGGHMESDLSGKGS